MKNKENETKYILEPAKLFLVFGIVFLCIGVGIITSVAVVGGMTLAKINRYTVTTGTVIDYKITKGYKKNSNGVSQKVDMYAEIAEFEVDGVKYTVTNGISSTSGVKDLGEKVEIAYNPENPHDCVFVTSNNIAGIAVVAVLGIALTVAGTWLTVYYRKQYKEWKASLD